MYGLVYLVSLDGAGVYVGQTTRPLKQRWQKHVSDARCGRQTPLACALRKYGHEAFALSVLEHAVDREQLNAAEVRQIAALAPRYNACAGGGGLGAPTPEVREKIAFAMKRRVFSVEHKTRISDGLRGRPVSAAQREKLHTALKGRSVRKSPLTEKEIAALVFRNKARRIRPQRHDLLDAYARLGAETRAQKISTAARIGYETGARERRVGARNPMYGIAKTEAQKQQLSEKARGQNNPFFGATHNADTKAKMSAAHAARPQVECPHCGVQGRSNAMLRWHFDNCRSK